MHVCTCTRPRARVPTYMHARTHAHISVTNTFCFSTATMIGERASVLRYTYITCLASLVIESKYTRAGGSRVVFPSCMEHGDRDSSVGCRSQWPSGLRRGSAADHLLGLRVRIPPGAWMSVCCVLYSTDKKAKWRTIRTKHRVWMKYERIQVKSV